MTPTEQLALYERANSVEAAGVWIAADLNRFKLYHPAIPTRGIHVSSDSFEAAVVAA